MKKAIIILVTTFLVAIFTGCEALPDPTNYIPNYTPIIVDETPTTQEVVTQSSAVSDYPITNDPYYVVNNNLPYFRMEEYAYSNTFECYSALDDLGRCGVAFAKLGPETMPTEPRGEIGMIKPSGWHSITYPDLIEDRYLYNRCHLIAYQLSGENANELNLITGTRYMNVEGMLPFEVSVIQYIEDTGNHVLYRVTPIFDNDNLVANGVLMEAYSMEDMGEGICFCVFVNNIQPGITIDYATGESHVTES